ncbi:hypothetical protein [Aurantiacibacter spongiae]|uniref:Uncharacterized protein n=1 Tax=Aurantiacibacter spongiae TaxID=2488860 RepID=A0A3N5D9X0_9SPHN|nr:hypothetical protein [Aurantiacibacter spongiae]RPF71438.1 hypothetical protein EG799_07285 [Aurantiacibacter spongiae]
MRFLPAIVLTALVAACVPSPQQAPAPPERPRETVQIPPTAPPPRPRTGFRPPQINDVPGLSAIVRQNAATLRRRFGPPRLTVTEGDMRKLQFSGQACVLDVYLYPLSQGAEPVATWVEARRASDGAAVDRAACAQALAQR